MQRVRVHDWVSMRGKGSGKPGSWLVREVIQELWVSGPCWIRITVPKT